LEFSVVSNCEWSIVVEICILYRIQRKPFSCIRCNPSNRHICSVGTSTTIPNRHIYSL